MRIVIDMQGAQTESRYRGIGRYTLAFAQAVARNRGEHETILALNGLFPETIEPIRAAFEGVLPQENIRVWHAPGPVNDEDPANSGRREVAELVREAFLASLCPDVIHLSSLFEGYVDDAVTSIGRFDHRTPVTVILYDLIPLLNPEQYLEPSPNYTAYYKRKILSLKRAELHFAISEHTRQEGLDCLGVEFGHIVNVSTATGPEFQKIEVDEQARRVLYSKLGLSRPFVLYTGGVDERKNLPRLIEAWSRLPATLRATHQLLVAGKMPSCSAAELQCVAQKHGLKDGELLLCDYVSDEELVQLYNICELYVFPSWHEGFGLPALEAMACGAPVIGSNTTSLPEVIGLEAALFDPFDAILIAEKISQVLEDDEFKATLRRHGLQQAKKFCWDETAKRAIVAWESLHAIRSEQCSITFECCRKPRLAYVSPMPPERTGIADYSAELIPALSEYYDIELIVAQKKIDDPWINKHVSVRDEDWLRSHAEEVDRVLYQMGNSPFHRHMLRLMEEVPGTVVLHDFYLSGLMAWQEYFGGEAGAWVSALYDSHGYRAVCKRFSDEEQAKQLYPASWRVFQLAQGVIVHSEYSRSLARRWFGPNASSELEVIPLLRAPAVGDDRQTARRKLGIGEREFIVCSFGFLADVKLNHRLLNAWLSSELAREVKCRLILVGENGAGEYGASLLRIIRESGLENRIHITGFASPDVYRQYLEAADLAVQLRTLSRGETSAAVLDCMNYGLPLIVNSNGSMGELDPDAVWMLRDEFSDAELKDALEVLWRDDERRRIIAAKARQLIHDRHSPVECSRRYAEAIERFQQETERGLPSLYRAIALQNSFTPTKPSLLQLSQAMAMSFPLSQPAKRLFLDVTATYRQDLKTGIERVARAIMIALLESPPAGYRVEPVYLTEVDGVWLHRYARSYTMDILGCPVGMLNDEPIDPQHTDIMLVLDISGESLIRAEQAGLFASYRNCGVTVYSIVYDLLPIRMPEVFPQGAGEAHARWLQAVATFDGAICISKAVADDLKDWLKSNGYGCKARRICRVGWWHLGADLAHSAPSTGLPDDAENVLQQLVSRPSFLMVGTIEPRKGYLQTLDAFAQLWRQGIDVNLVIVGREGWVGLPDVRRRDIPETVARFHGNSELNRRLFWLEGISDEFLESVYASSSCLIAASYGEGYGLPLVEAAKYRLPIIARDIPVFREVAGAYAYYFRAENSVDLAEAIRSWLRLYESCEHPDSSGISWLTWSDSAAWLAKVTLEC